MGIRVQNAERAPQTENTAMEHNKKDSGKGIVSSIAGVCLGLAGVVSAGLSTLAGYSSVHYIHSYFNPPEDSEKIFEKRQEKMGFWGSLSNELSPEEKRSVAAFSNRVKCAEVQKRLLDDVEEIKKKEKLLSNYRNKLKDYRVSYHEQSVIKNFLNSYEKGDNFLCEYNLKYKSDIELCKEMNAVRDFVNKAPTKTELAQSAWRARGDLSLCLEEDPLNAATAGVLITASVVAAYASYRLLKKAFSS